MILSHYPTDPTLHVFVLSSSTTLFIKRKKQQRRRRRQLTKTFINNTITALWQMLRVMLTWIAQCALWLVTKKKKARGTLNQSWNATRQTQLQIDSKNFAALRPVSHMIFWNFTASHCCLFVCPFVSVTFSLVLTSHTLRYDYYISGVSITLSISGCRWCNVWLWPFCPEDLGAG